MLKLMRLYNVENDRLGMHDCDIEVMQDIDDEFDIDLDEDYLLELRDELIDNQDDIFVVCEIESVYDVYDNKKVDKMSGLYEIYDNYVDTVSWNTNLYCNIAASKLGYIC